MGTIREQILLASALDSGTIRQHLAEPNTGSGDGSCVLGVVLQDIDTVVVEQVMDFAVEIQEPETVVVDLTNPSVELEPPDIEVELE